MFNEHVYRCSLNNKRTILYISAENQQANKLCKILSFHVRRFFEHYVARFKISSTQDGTTTKRNNWNNTWILNPVGGFYVPTRIQRCVCGCWIHCIRVWGNLNLCFIPKSRWEISKLIAWTGDERTKYGWMKKEKIVCNGARNLISTGGCDNFTLLNYNCLATSKRRKDNITN